MPTVSRVRARAQGLRDESVCMLARGPACPATNVAICCSRPFSAQPSNGEDSCSCLAAEIRKPGSAPGGVSATAQTAMGDGAEAVPAPASRDVPARQLVQQPPLLPVGQQESLPSQAPRTGSVAGSRATSRNPSRREGTGIPVAPVAAAQPPLQEALPSPAAQPPPPVSWQPSQPERRRQLQQPAVPPAPTAQQGWSTPPAVSSSSGEIVGGGCHTPARLHR